MACSSELQVSTPNKTGTPVSRLMRPRLALRSIAAWDDALRNYGPNLGYDYGGRLVAAWLDR